MGVSEIIFFILKRVLSLRILMGTGLLIGLIEFYKQTKKEQNVTG